MTNLIALEDTGEIARVYHLFKEVLSNGQIVPTNIGYQGKSWNIEVVWHKRFNFWCYFDPEWRAPPGSYGCIFGIGDPNKIKRNSITVEINFDHSHPRKIIAGRFLKSGDQYFIGHSGKLGGSKEGTGKERFLNFYNVGNLVPMQWSDNTLEDVIVIGSLADPSFTVKIAEFINQAAKFKNESNIGAIKKGNSDTKPIIPKFTSEFYGVKQYTTPENTIVVKTDHGLIVSILKDELQKLGYSSTNDPVGSPARDLYIPLRNNEAKVLFEIKTDVSTNNIYTGIGQLMFHGAWQKQVPRRILVIPERPDEKTSKILDCLNIEVLHYKMDNEGVIFSQLKQLIGKTEN